MERRLRGFPVALGPVLQEGDQLVGEVPDDPVGGDQLVVPVVDGGSLEPFRLGHGPVDGPAPDERLVVPLHLRGEEVEEEGDELCLAARPLEEGAGGDRFGVSGFTKPKTLGKGFEGVVFHDPPYTGCQRAGSLDLDEGSGYGNFGG